HAPEPTGPRGLSCFQFARPRRCAPAAQPVAQIDQRVQRLPAATAFGFALQIALALGIGGADLVQQPAGLGLQRVIQFLEGPALQFHLLRQRRQGGPQSIGVAAPERCDVIAGLFTGKGGKNLGIDSGRRFFGQREIQQLLEAAQDLVPVHLRGHLPFNTSRQTSGPANSRGGVWLSNNAASGAPGSVASSMARVRLRGSRRVSKASRIFSNSSGERSGGYSFTL